MTTFQCPTCAVRYRLNSMSSGEQIRCRQCETVFRAPQQVLSLQPLPSALPREADQLGYEIVGRANQCCEITVDPAESIIANRESLLFHSPVVQLESVGPAENNDTSAVGLVRCCNPSRSRAKLGLAAPGPGPIIEFRLDHIGGVLSCRMPALLCASPDVQPQRETATFDSFLKLTGSGVVLLHCAGTEISKELGDDEQLIVHRDSLLAYCGVELHDGQCESFLTVTGPGQCWLQSGAH